MVAKKRMKYFIASMSSSESCSIGNPRFTVTISSLSSVGASVACSLSRMMFQGHVGASEGKDVGGDVGLSDGA